MVRIENPFQLLYVSRLAPGRTWEIMKEIADAARRNNPAHGITGALLFDGERFCQLIEGEEPAVRALMDNISRDPRHIDVKLLFTGRLPSGPSTLRWVCGYCDAHELEAFDTPPGPAEDKALDWFFTVLRGADME
ncbi:MAG: BLUF domain-containing protein [Burkholderiaceae bacterium]